MGHNYVNLKVNKKEAFEYPICLQATINNVMQINKNGNQEIRANPHLTQIISSSPPGKLTVCCYWTCCHVRWLTARYNCTYILASLCLRAALSLSLSHFIFIFADSYLAEWRNNVHGYIYYVFMHSTLGPISSVVSTAAYNDYCFLHICVVLNILYVQLSDAKKFFG